MHLGRVGYIPVQLKSPQSQQQILLVPNPFLPVPCGVLGGGTESEN